MIYFLDGNQEVIKIARSSAVISAIQTQELPEDNSLLKDYLSVRLKNDERLFNAQYMAIKSYGDNRNAFDLYRIASEIVPDNATEFVGVQVAPYELEGVVIEDLRPQNRGLNQTMSQVLTDSDWRLGYVADNLPNITTNFYYASAKDALKKIQELANVEMIFKVEISGNKITDKWVEVYHQLGNRTMKRFNYGTNALSVVRESSHDELYTALIGRGKSEEVGETESGDATYGRKINFADVEWKMSAGRPVDKPKGQKYIELPNATAEYGIKLLDGRKVPRIGIVEFSDTDDPEILIQETYQELLVRARPKVLFKASVINIGDVLIGDTVTIHRHDLDFHYQARVRKVVRDRKNNNKTQVEIGDVVHTPSTKRQGQINSALNNVADDLENVRGEVTEARRSADGKNTNFYGNVEPDRKKVGDTWFRDHPSLTGESQILVWNGEAWELIMDTADTTKNAREIEAVIERAQTDKEALETEINQTYEDAVDEADRLAAIRDDGITITAGQISAGTIDTARLDAVSIVTSGLSANVVKANHIQADNALFDKLFTSTLATDRLSAQQAWIKNINIANASIDGAKIQDATIGSAKIANIDANKITTGELKGVRVYAKTGEIGEWTLSSGILSSQTSYGFTTLKATGEVALGVGSPERYSTTGAHLQIWHDGQLRFSDGSAGSNATLKYTDGKFRIYGDRFDIGSFPNRVDKYFGKDADIDEISTEKINLPRSTFIGKDSNGNMSFQNRGGLYLRPGTSVYSCAAIRPYINNGEHLGGADYRWSRVWTVDGVSESSDVRLKNNIVDIPPKLLNGIEQVGPKMYEMNGKTKFGYIAQDVERELFKYATQVVGYKNASEYMKQFDVLDKNGESYQALIYSQVEVLKGAYRDKKIEKLEERIKELENAG